MVIIQGNIVVTIWGIYGYHRREYSGYHKGEVVVIIQKYVVIRWEYSGNHTGIMWLSYKGIWWLSYWEYVGII